MRNRFILAIIAVAFASTFAFAQDVVNPQTDASKLTTGTLATARLPVVPIANGGCNSASGCVVAAKTTQVISSQTITRATGVRSVTIWCKGSGGGGAGAAAAATGATTGGGGGEGSESVVTLNAPAADYVVTIGAAANGGATGANNGTAGNDTSVVVNGVTVCVGKGGSAGTQNGANRGGIGGAGGIAGTGDITNIGLPGISGLGDNNFTGDVINPQGGGRSAASTIAKGGAISGQSAGANTGAGGNGGVVQGSASTAAGGNGGSGKVTIAELTNQ